MLIGEVARASGVSARMLRHYDALGLVRPTGRTGGGYREYDDADLRRLFQVESLRTLGLSLQQIGRALADPACAPETLVGDLIAWTRERIAREEALLARLRAIDATAPTGWEDVLATVDLLRELDSGDAARRQRAVLTAERGAVPADVFVDALVDESEPNVSGALRWALGRAGHDGAAALASAARSDDPEVRRRALEALSAMPVDETVVAALHTALLDADLAVRERAALALGRPGSGVVIDEEVAPTLTEVLVAMVVAGRDDVAAAEALGVLARRGVGSRIVGAIAAELRSSAGESAVRLRLAQALVDIDDPAARGLLLDLADDPDATVALVASALVNAHAADPTRPTGGH